MQNLKSLNNLIEKPVLGANDDKVHSMSGHPAKEIYSYEDEMKDVVRGIMEPQRGLLWKQFFPESHQS